MQILEGEKQEMNGNAVKNKIIYEHENRRRTLLLRLDFHAFPRVLINFLTKEQQK